MRVNFIIAATIGTCLAMSMGVANAQQNRTSNVCDRVAAEKKASCVEFLDTHVWNEGKSDWVLKPGAKSSGPMPKGMMTKEEIRAERTKFLATNRWDEGKSMWVPIDGKPRDVCEDKACTKTRAEVKADTQAFLKTHRFDEGKGVYVPK